MQPLIGPVLDFTVTGPHAAALDRLYRLGTVFDLTDIHLEPAPAGAARITATSPLSPPPQQPGEAW